VATPYDGMGIKFSGSDIDDEEEKIALALDKWVSMIAEQYPDQKAEWAEPLPEAEGVDEETAVESETKPYIDMIRRIIFQQTDGDKTEIANWDDSTVLMEFAKESLKEATGFDPSFFGTTPKDILDNVIGMLPEISGNGDEAEETQKEKES
jgi:hypothetical protein